jgi:hypothetical protein
MQLDNEGTNDLKILALNLKVVGSGFSAVQRKYSTSAVKKWTVKIKGQIF